MASPPPPSAPKRHPMEAEITVVSAKHLKNVNWRRGELQPYAVVYFDPDRRVTTKPDDAGSTRPVWNEKLVIPVPPTEALILTVEIFHAKPSETPNPLVGTARVPLWDLAGIGSSSVPIKSLELRRPSGRPQGKVRIKVAVRELYYSGGLPQPVGNYDGYAPSSPYCWAPNYQYADSGYYSGGFYAPPPPPPSRPYYGGPSAPAEYSSASNYDQKGRDEGKLGSGSAVGEVSGSFSGLSLKEEAKYKEEEPIEKAEEHHLGRDHYRREGY